MNLILLESFELDGNRATLQDHRARHIREVLRAQVGDVLRVGILDGAPGQGQVLEIDERSVTLDCVMQSKVAPRGLDTLLLSVPRPKILQRCLAHAAALGFGRIILFRSWRVDKSHLRSKVLEAEQLRRHLITGLEQSRRTQVPEVLFFPLFKPFVEDRLDEVVPPPEEAARFVAHPVAATRTVEVELPPEQPFTLALGPEGGFIEYEIGSLQERGFCAINAGPHPLRVETALAVLHGQLSLLRDRA